MSDTLRLPIRATYHFDADGTMTRTHAEYADISADTFVRFLMTGLCSVNCSFQTTSECQ